MAGGDDDQARARDLLDRMDEVAAVRVGQAEIEEHQIERLGADRSECLNPVMGCEHIMAG